MATIKNLLKSTVATWLITNYTYGANSEDSSAEDAAANTLTGEITATDLARAAMTVSNPSSYVALWVKVWTSATTYALNSFGIFSAASAGDMILVHKWSATQSLISGSTFTVTAQITVAQGSA